MMSDKEFAELELRATICPGQVSGLNPSTSFGKSCTRPSMKRVSA
jgi:hypothetical protein